MEENYKSQSVSDSIKRIVTSKSFLCIVIFQIVGLIAGFIENSQSNRSILQILSKVHISGIDGYDIYGKLASMFSGIEFVLAIILAIPVALLCVGYCLLYLGEKLSKRKLSINGCYLIAGYLIIYLLLSIVDIINVVIEIISLIAQGKRIINYFLPIVVTGSAVYLSLLYYKQLIETVLGVALSLKTDENACIISMFVVVYNWILAVVLIIGELFAMLIKFNIDFVSLSNIVGLILITTIMTKYKKENGVPSKRAVKRIRESVKNNK